MNAIGSFSVTWFSLWREEIYLLWKNPTKIKSGATKGKICKKSISTTLVVHINKGILK